MRASAFALRSVTSLVPNASVISPVRISLRDSIESRANNYTLIRLVLAASVLYFHSFWMIEQRGQVDAISLWLNPMTSLGGMAVACFFFLSGLFVSQSFHRDQSGVSFMLRRAARIWPGLFVCVALTTALAAIASQGRDAWHLFLTPEFHTYISSNSTLQLEYLVPGIYESTRTRGLNGSLHTLPIEVAMYAVVAAAGMLGLLRRPGWIAMTGAFLLIIALFQPTYFTAPLDIVKHGQLPVAMFLAGCMMYGLSGRIHVATWQFAPLATLTWLTEGGLHTVAFFSTAIWVMLYIGQLPVLTRHLQLRSDLSFGTYIYGYPCQQLILTIWPDVEASRLTACALLLALGFAWLSWNGIEKPGIAFGRQLVARWKRFRLAPTAEPSMPDSSIAVPVATFWTSEAVLITSLLAGFALITCMGAWLQQR